MILYDAMDPGQREADRAARRSKIAGAAVVVLVGASVLFGLVVFATRGPRQRAAEAAAPVVDHAAAQGLSLTTPIPAWLVLIVLFLVVRRVFRLGQYARGYGHARTIRKSHWAAIQGRGH